MIQTWSCNNWARREDTFLSMNSEFGLGICVRACCKTDTLPECTTEFDAEGERESEDPWQCTESVSTWTIHFPTVVSNNLHIFKTTKYAALFKRKKTGKISIYLCGVRKK